MTEGFGHRRFLAPRHDASHAIRVPRVRILPSASFRSHLTMGTLAVRLGVPVIKASKGLAPSSHFPVGFRLPVDSARQGAARHAWRTSGRPGSLLTLAPTDPDVRVLPHPAPRQMASLRAVAYPLVQEARRWPPPSPRLIWPVRLSVVVTWRRDPPSVCWPSFPPPVPPAGAPFPPRGLVGSIPPLRRYYETLRLLAVHPPALRCLRPAVPSEHLRLRSVGRQVLRPRPRAW